VATLKAIRKRISSIRNTQQITKAMKMVSAAKLRRAQEAAVAARPYAEKMTDLLKNLAARVVSNAHPLLTVREEKRIQLVLLTSDRGLCGGYNANLIRAAEAFRREQGPEKEVQLTLIGRKGADYFRRRHVEISDRYVNILATPPEELAAEIAEKLINRFADSAEAFARVCRGDGGDGTTDRVSLRARDTRVASQFAAEDYRSSYSAGFAGSNRQRAWRAYDGHGFRDDERIEDDGDTDVADEPRAPGFDHARADGDRRNGGSFKVRN
jgi:hypothetical protein